MCEHYPWLIDSIERLICKNTFLPSPIFHYFFKWHHLCFGTVYTLANGLVSRDGVVGFAYDALKRAFYGEDADRFMLVQYKTLTTKPLKVQNPVMTFWISLYSRTT